MSLMGLYDQTDNHKALDEQTKIMVIEDVIDQINHDYSSAILQSPTENEQQEIREKLASMMAATLRKHQCRPGTQVEAQLVEELSHRILGLGFLDLLLPSTRTDISEITIYSSGLVQIMKKGSVRWETVDLHPQAGEIWRVLDRLLGPQNKTLNETNPSINAKLPATPHNPGGDVSKPCIR